MAPNPNSIRRAFGVSASNVLRAGIAISAVVTLCAAGCGGGEFTSGQPSGGASGSSVGGTGGSGGGTPDAATGGTGGSNTGGSNTGGSNTGGSNTGGSNTGGSNTGGSNTGGSNTGGSNTGGSNTGGASGCTGDGACTQLNQPDACLAGQCIGGTCKAAPLCQQGQKCCNGACQTCCVDDDCTADIQNCQKPTCHNGACTAVYLCTSQEMPYCCPGSSADQPGACGECCGAGAQPQCAGLNNAEQCVMGTCAILDHVCHETSCQNVGQQCCAAGVSSTTGCCAD